MPRKKNNSRKALAHYLETLKASNDWTTKRMCEALDISPTVLARLRRQGVSVGIDMVDHIATKAGTTTSKILWGDE